MAEVMRDGEGPTSYGVARATGGHGSHAPSDDSPADGGVTSRRQGPWRLRLPLAVVVARYFLYLLVGSAFIVGVPVLTFAMLMEGGSVLPANYGETHVQETAETLLAQSEFDAVSLSSAYRFVHLSADGSEVIASDAASDEIAKARALALSSPLDEVTAAGSSVVIPLDDGTWCVLSYTLVPQWSDRALRDSWPNPQDLLFICVGIPLLLLVVLVAWRAGRVLTRKMTPLVQVADAVAAQNLDFSVGTSNVAQIDDVLAAMERMRDSLRESLEARWRAEEAQRIQMAALAHDLGTPLTVIGANADYLEEEELRPEARAAAEAIARGARQLGDYSRLIMDVSREGSVGLDVRPLGVSRCADVLEHEACRLAQATGIRLDVERTPAFVALGDSACLEVDEMALVRAMANVVKNAIGHSPEGGVVRLRFDCSEDSLFLSVCDEGAGFSSQALAHGAERFFRDDASRSGAGDGAHYGLGLAIVADVMEALGGRVELANSEKTGGALVRLALPLTRCSR